MSAKKKRQLVILNAIIIIVNIAMFSNMFLGFSLLEGTVFQLCISWLTVIASVVVFVKGNLSILKNEEIHVLARDVKTLEDCTSVFEEAIHNGDVFDNNIKKNMEQIKRFTRKYNAIKDMLLQKFSADEITYKKFMSVLNDVQKVIYMNMKSIINKMSAFDVEEYEGIVGNKANQKFISQEKMDIYNTYIKFVNEATDVNEEILLKLDKMVLEISQYNTIDGGDIKKMPALMEMDELIKNAKRYK